MLDEHGSYPEEKEREREYIGGEKKERRKTDRQTDKERDDTEKDGK